jgi:uncharacterized membrane protein YkgB
MQASPTYTRVEARLTEWMTRNSVPLLRWSLGGVFLWFGLLKFFPNVSPAQSLAGETMACLSGGLLSSSTSVLILAVWETLIGVGLIAGRFLRATLALLWLQMLGTFTPFLLFPDLCFQAAPFVPTLEGQYILKNVVLLSASVAIAASLRTGEGREDLR